MIPTVNLAVQEAEQQPSQSSRTFYLNLGTNRIEGELDGLAAVEQSIMMMLSTERYAYLIFDWDYGAKLEKYIGKPFDYIVGDIDREIRETLLTDDRITNVGGFTFRQDGNVLTVRFTVDTIFGSTNMKAAVSI